MKTVSGYIQYNKLWDTSRDVVFFTANQVVKNNGELVMGAGNAKAARDAVRGAAKRFGKNLGSKHLHVENFVDITLAALVTKVHYKDKSEIDFVVRSLRYLYKYAVDNPEKTLHVPYPAIGLGGLSKEELDVYMYKLPDNVLVYS